MVITEKISSKLVKIYDKHPEMKDYSDEERLKTFRQLGVDYEMDKLKRFSDFNVHFDNWFSETSLYENGAIDNTLAKMNELGYTYEAEYMATYI